MEMTTYYGMDKNPFTKDATVSTLFTSNDFNQMTNRLEFIIRSRGIGVFLSSPGMCKTTCLRKTLEPFRQRINMNYTFTGFNEEEVKNYVISRLQSVNCRSDLFKDECYHTLYSLMNTSVRTLNLLINKSLILSMHYNKEVIDSELIMEASKELMLG